MGENGSTFSSPILEGHVVQIQSSDWLRAIFNDMHCSLVGYGPYKRTLLHEINTKMEKFKIYNEYINRF